MSSSEQRETLSMPSRIRERIKDTSSLAKLYGSASILNAANTAYTRPML